MKKTYKQQYSKGKKIKYLDIPEMTYLTIEGTGGPNTPEFERVIGLLYKITYTLRMSYKKQLFEQYEPYTVGPLEGIWTTADNKQYDQVTKTNLNYKLMIAQPAWFTKAMYNTLLEIIKPDMPTITEVKYEKITEGQCVQILHVGPFDTEPNTLAPVYAELEANGKSYDPASHHEIYLSDFRRTAPERLNTIIRYQITNK